MQKYPLVRPTAHDESGPVHFEKDGGLEPLEGRRKKSFGTKHVSACMPFIADVRDGATYASWPVWSGSTTKQARFEALPKKTAMRIYHKAMKWNGSGKLAKCHGGVIGSHVMLVLHTLIFEFLNYGTGRLDPSYAAIQRKTRLCRQTVAKALARLKELGIVNWIRRCREDRDEDGRFMLRQKTNAYAILPPTQWRGYTEHASPEPPDPSSWGACPPLPSLIEQASADIQAGDSARTVINRLDADPGDAVAQHVASLFRAIRT